jgi:hypothetical protein
MYDNTVVLRIITIYIKRTINLENIADQPRELYCYYYVQYITRTINLENIARQISNIQVVYMYYYNVRNPKIKDIVLRSTTVYKKNFNLENISEQTLRATYG